MLADFAGKLVTRNFKTLKEYQEATKQDKHSVEVDYRIFAHVEPPDKNDPQRLYNPEDFYFQLQPVVGGFETGQFANPAIDAGMLLPTINDDFTGAAPDLGAYERGVDVPHYGPRQWPVSSLDASAPRSLTGPPH